MNQEEYDARYTEIFTIETGKQIKIWRNYRGLKQKELGHRASLNPQHISDIERGLSKIFLETLSKLDNVLDIDLNEFLKTIQEEVDRLIQLEEE